MALDFLGDLSTKKATTIGSKPMNITKAVGKKTADKLLAHFKSVKKIKEASVEELTELVGEKIAIKLKELKIKLQL